MRMIPGDEFDVILNGFEACLAHLTIEARQVLQLPEGQPGNLLHHSVLIAEAMFALDQIRAGKRADRRAS